MAIIPTDILVKTALEAGLNDLRKNNFILDDVIAGLATDMLSKTEYGYKEIHAYKQWFLSNKIPVYLDFRVDSPEMPCITITSSPRAEMIPRTSLGDSLGGPEDISTEKVSINPIKVYENFTPSEYDKTNGVITFPSGITTEYAVVGQFLVSSRTGKAYQILEIIGNTQFRIKANVNEDFTDAYVVPPVSVWNLQREITFVQETVYIGVHTQSDPVQNQWLHDTVWYILLRCKEVYFEGRGFELSTMQSDAMYLNPNFKETDRIFSRNINLSGQIEINFIKYAAPKLQDVRGVIRIADGPKTPPGTNPQDYPITWQMEGDE